MTDRLDVTLRLVRNAGRASLTDLASRLGVSEMTVRRDLDALQARGLVERVRGGAVAVAEMAAQVEQARAFYRQVAHLLDLGVPCEEAAMVKLEATEMAVPVTTQAMQLHAATATPSSGRWSGTGLTPG